MITTTTSIRIRVIRMLEQHILRRRSVERFLNWMELDSRSSEKKNPCSYVNRQLIKSLTNMHQILVRCPQKGKLNTFCILWRPMANWGTPLKYFKIWLKRKSEVLGFLCIVLSNQQRPTGYNTHLTTTVTQVAYI